MLYTRNYSRQTFPTQIKRDNNLWESEHLITKPHQRIACKWICKLIKWGREKKKNWLTDNCQPSLHYAWLAKVQYWRIWWDSCVMQKQQSVIPLKRTSSRQKIFRIAFFRRPVQCFLCTSNERAWECSVEKWCAHGACRERERESDKESRGDGLLGAFPPSVIMKVESTQAFATKGTTQMDASIISCIFCFHSILKHIM